MNSQSPNPYGYRRKQQVATLLEALAKENIPLALLLKNYFSIHKEMGSRDRKEVRSIVFSVLRLMLLKGEKDFASVLSAIPDDDFSLPYIEAELARFSRPENVRLSWRQRISSQLNVEQYIHHLSNPLPVYAYVFRSKPEKFIEELRALNEDIIIENPPGAIVFPPGINLSAAKLYRTGRLIIQDKGSQLLCMEMANMSKGSSWWDVCSGSGGKALGILHRKPDAYVQLSDVRENILETAITRLKAAGATGYNVFRHDTEKKALEAETLFDNIVVDAPCTGSGTWSRDPAAAIKFEEGKIEEYAQRQKSIVENASRSLRVGGILHYFTCSVFEDENEKVAHEFLSIRPNFTLVNMNYVDGAGSQCEYMFRASFQRTA